MLSINGFINDYKNIYRFTFNENLLYLFVELTMSFFLDVDFIIIRMVEFNHLDGTVD